MRAGSFYAHRHHKLGPCIGRKAQDWPLPVRDGWVLSWYHGPRLGRVMARTRQPSAAPGPLSDTGEGE